MTFATPLWLWALFALPLLAAAESWTTSRDRSRVARLAARALWPRVVRREAEAWRFLRLGLLLLGVACLVLALARPQWGIVREKIEREGVDCVLVLDTSGSMATEDVAPSRLFLARNAILNLVSRLEGDRFALVAFEGEAHALVPLTLDADAIGLFLDSVEPGIVSSPGSSLGRGLAKGLEMFVDKERRNKVLVLVSDGEDLEGEVEEAVRRAREAGAVVHTVGVGSENGQPVPDFDKDGNRIGFKRDEAGAAVVSRLHPETLEAMARGTGGRFVRITPVDTSLAPIAAAIEAMEQKSLAREYSYRKKERFQIPLGISLGCLTLALLMPLPLPSRRKAAALAAALPLALLASEARADGAHVMDEVLLRPRRATAEARREYDKGNHQAALEAFDRASASRPSDPRARFNQADGLYKNGRYDEAETLYRALAADPRSGLAGPSRFNLGNTLFQKQDYPGAIGAYRDALALMPGDLDARRNLELALLAMEREQEEKKKQKEQQEQEPQDQRQQEKKDPKGKGSDAPREPPRSDEEKERERFQKEAGMPKERAMQLLEALQQNEKAEQKRLLAPQKAQRKKGKDW